MAVSERKRGSLLNEVVWGFDYESDVVLMPSSLLVYCFVLVQTLERTYSDQLIAGMHLSDEHISSRFRPTGGDRSGVSATCDLWTFAPL